MKAKTNKRQSSTGSRSVKAVQEESERICEAVKGMRPNCFLKCTLDNDIDYFFTNLHTYWRTYVTDMHNTPHKYLGPSVAAGRVL